MQARSPLDRLTENERKVVRAWLAHPGAPLWQLGQEAGLKGKDRRTLRDSVQKILKRPAVVAALRTPPPTVTLDADEVRALMSDPVKAKELLITWYWRVVKSDLTPQSERIRALNSVANAVPGFNVPVGVHHSGAFNLQQFVEAAGGKPPEAPSEFKPEKEMPN